MKIMGVTILCLHTETVRTDWDNISIKTFSVSPPPLNKCKKRKYQQRKTKRECAILLKNKTFSTLLYPPLSESPYHILIKDYRYHLSENDDKKIVDVANMKFSTKVENKTNVKISDFLSWASEASENDDCTKFAKMVGERSELKEMWQERIYSES